MAPEEIERRVNVWQALSDLFLDTEIEEFTYQYIAKAVLDSGYGPEEIKRILWQEIFPVLESNLKSVAGVWEGFPREWLKQHISVSTVSNPISSSETVDEIHSCWGKVCEYLPREYA